MTDFIIKRSGEKVPFDRSKLEKWLEEQLIKMYPNLEIHFNRKDAINSELDIYKFLKDKNINVQDRSKLQESIDKIKSLMFF